MEDNVLNVSAVIVYLYIGIKVFLIDNQFQNTPFGPDEEKNLKYTKGRKGEDYGTGTFWGRPNMKDTLSMHLDKIQWLSHSQDTDTFWRRSLFGAVISGILIAVGTQNAPFISRLTLSIMLSFILSYFTHSFYKTHVIWMRNKIIDTHISRIKKKLNLSLVNELNENLNATY
jgi:hypothetical protein